MNSLEQLANQINETKEIIQVCKRNHEAIGLPDFVSELEISSLQQRLVDLERKQKNDKIERSRSEQLEVIMYPEELPPGHIQVRTLTIILGGLQSLTDSVANTLYNQPSDRGPIPQEILDSNSWILKTVRAGSFVQFDTEKLQKIFYILNEKLTCNEEEVQFEGRLTGINVRTGLFELCAEDGDKVTGRILKEIIPEAIKNVDRKCKAQLLKTTTTSSAGKVRIQLDIE